MTESSHTTDLQPSHFVALNCHLATLTVHVPRDEAGVGEGSVNNATTRQTSSLMPTNCASFSSKTPTPTPEPRYSSTLFEISGGGPTTNFSQFGFSPGTIQINLKEVETRITEDQIFDEDFAKIPKDGVVVQGCIVFLYAREFFSTLSRDERVAQIKKCVDIDSKSLQRLRRIVFSDASDRIQYSDKAFEHFFRMAETARLFFLQDGVVGGFPMEPVMRLQASSNNCYIVSVCMWLTLMLQRKFPESEDEAKPIDVAHCARHWVICDDKSLVTRVVDNTGGCAERLAMDLTGVRDPDSWDRVDFDNKDALVNGMWTLSSLKYYGFGLVTKFRVKEPFRNAPLTSRNETRLGFWKFDDIHCDCEGEFIVVEEDGSFDSQRSYWQQKWTDLRDIATEAKRNVATPCSPCTPTICFPMHLRPQKRNMKLKAKSKM